MARPLPSPPLLVITDRTQASRPLEDVAAAAFDGGCRWLSLREKDLSSAERRRLAESLVRRAEPYRARVGVHEDVQLAASLGLRALHLPANASVARAKALVDPRCLIGKSCHSVAECAAAAAEGADYVTLSPIFLSRSKPGYGPALGLEPLSSAAATAKIPVLALAGITVDTGAACRRAGAAGAAVMGEVMRAADPTRLVQTLLSALTPR